MSLGKKIRGGFAALLSASLVVSGALLVAPAASAVDAPTPAPAPATATATVQVASETGLTVQVDVTGISPSPLPERSSGVYIGAVEAGSTVRVGGAAYVAAAAITSGNASASLQLDTALLDRSKNYEAVVWYAHGALIPEAIVARATVPVTPQHWELVFPPAGTGSEGGTGDPSDVVPEPEPEPITAPVPALELVGSVADLDPEAANIVTVRGSGFLPSAPATSGARPPLAGKFTGVYVAFGSYASVWQPSTGVASSTRSGVDVKWAVPAESMATIGGPAAGAIELLADGTFETTLTLTPNESKAVVDGSWGIVTYPGGGSKYAPFETFTAVTFAEPVILPTVEIVEPVADLDPSVEHVVTVKGTGFLENAPATNGTRPPLSGKFSGTYVVFGSFLEDWQPSQNIASSARSIIHQKWALPAASSAIGGASWVELAADGSFETTLTLKYDEVKALENGRYGVYTMAGSGAKYAPFETFTPVTFAEPVPVPALELVGSVADLDPEVANIVTVRGSGFLPSAPATSGARPPLAGKFTGVYVAFGSYASVWQPSTGAASSTRSGVDVKWAVPAESMATIGGPAAGAIELLADGTFETTLTLTPNESKAVVHGSWGIVTYPGGGSKYVPFETFTAVTFAEPSEEGLTARIGTITPGEGLKIDVAASGLPSGIPFAYVAVFEKPAVAGSQLEMNAFTPVSGGSLSTSLEVPIASLDRTKSYEVVVWKQHSTLNEENLYQRADLSVTDAQWNELFDKPIKPTPIPQPAPAPAPAPASQSAGSLAWGISTSFAKYVTGNVAKGTITTSGVGGGVGGYVFPQASGSSWNPQTQTGSIPFSGVVTFSGHNGALSRTVSNPVITVTSPTSATISVSGQPFGTLNLAAASKSVGANGEITWSGVPVSGGFGYGSYDLAADPLTFTVGAVSGATFGSTSVTAPVNIQRTAASAPPATSGVRVITEANELVAGGEIEFEASGFQPGERGILVVMYSEPTVLDTNAGADANGVVRWIGTLPEDLTGEHTITLQGSINVGKVITIAAAEPVKKTAVNTAEVEDAQIAEVQAAGVSDSDGPGWVIWVGALALLVVAGGLTALVVSQRRRAGGGSL